MLGMQNLCERYENSVQKIFQSLKASALEFSAKPWRRIFMHFQLKFSANPWWIDWCDATIFGMRNLCERHENSMQKSSNLWFRQCMFGISIFLAIWTTRILFSQQEISVFPTIWATRIAPTTASCLVRETVAATEFFAQIRRQLNVTPKWDSV